MSPLPQRGRWCALAVMLGALLGSACRNPPAGNFPRQGERRAAFAAGGQLTVRVPVGSVQVHAGRGPWIQLRWRIHRGHAWFWQRSRRLSSARLDFRAQGDSAEAIFRYPRGGSHGSIEATLRVPRQTALRIHLGVGKITVGRVIGDQFLDTGVGAIQLHLLDPLRYRAVQLRTGVGQIAGSPWPVQQHVVEQQVQAAPDAGPFRLDAHTGVGAIQLMHW